MLIHLQVTDPESDKKPLSTIRKPAHFRSIYPVNITYLAISAF